MPTNIQRTKEETLLSDGYSVTIEATNNLKLPAEGVLRTPNGNKLGTISYDRRVMTPSGIGRAIKELVHTTDRDFLNKPEFEAMTWQPSRGRV